jgi:Uncharacterized protein conserved in bacteria
MPDLLPPPACDYLIHALEHAPATLAALLSPLSSEHRAWETRPYPDRFSLREIVAHLADWDEIWRERIGRTVREDAPRLERPDVDQRARERGYAEADPQESLARFAERRAALVAELRALPEEVWGRSAHLERIGDLTPGGLVALVHGHDAYHIRQVAEWLAAALTVSAVGSAATP